MKYKIGDKVILKDLDWFIAQRDPCKGMSIFHEYYRTRNNKTYEQFAGKEATITHARKFYYKIDIDDGSFTWKHTTIKGRVNMENKRWVIIKRANGGPQYFNEGTWVEDISSAYIFNSWNEANAIYGIISCPYYVSEYKEPEKKYYVKHKHREDYLTISKSSFNTPLSIISNQKEAAVFTKEEAENVINTRLDPRNWTIEEIKEENTMNKETSTQEKIETIEKELKALKTQLEIESKPKKSWPDSHEEAFRIGLYWGLLVNGRRCLISDCSTDSFGIRGVSHYSSNESATKFWKGCGDLVGLEYSIIKFNSAKELYQWMSDGEELI